MTVIGSHQLKAVPHLLRTAAFAIPGRRRIPNSPLSSLRKLSGCSKMLVPANYGLKLTGGHRRGALALASLRAQPLTATYRSLFSYRRPAGSLSLLR
jgi:hypothetical protein